MLFDIFITLFLVALNGFFVAAEFAIVKVRASELEVKTTGKNIKVGKVAMFILDHLDAYLAATQLGITIASIGLGWFGERVFETLVTNLLHSFHLQASPELIHSIAIPCAFILVTFMHVVFGELAPKSIAIRYPFSTTMMVALPLRIFHFVFRPFIWVFNGFANFILSLIGIRTDGHGHGAVHSEDELRILIEETKNADITLDAAGISKYELLEKVFVFDDKMVKQIMTPAAKMFAVDIQKPFQVLFDRIIEEGYSRIPIYDEDIDNILGILHTKDLFKLQKKPALALRDVIRKPFFVPSTKRVGDLLQEFKKEGKQMAIITDEFGATMGLVTLEDIIEELLGEIYDEHDEEKSQQDIVCISDNEFIINGLASVPLLNTQLPNPLPEHYDYNTLSGYILQKVGRLPEVNDVFYADGYEFTVLQKHRARIRTVQLRYGVEPPQPQSTNKTHNASENPAS
ncbi:MAG TPA: hemolysin [Microscillaceae bacterium]|nr:hemolysin [Microscillaceae bacterium]